MLQFDLGKHRVKSMSKICKYFAHKYIFMQQHVLLPGIINKSNEIKLQLIAFSSSVESTTEHKLQNCGNEFCPKVYNQETDSLEIIRIIIK